MACKKNSDAGSSDPSRSICGGCGEAPVVSEQPCGCGALTTVSKCGCGETVKKKCGCQSPHIAFASSCCNAVPPAPPAPCCESHLPCDNNGLCLRPQATVVASEDPFTLQFPCDTDDFPITSEVYLYHEHAGFLAIHSHRGGNYSVSITDPALEGTVIEKDDCILVSVVKQSDADKALRCLVGNFVAPSVDSDSTIFIHNGAGIPVNSTISFQNGSGVIGTYTVKSFVSSGDNNVFVYTVTNTGQGHLPSTVIDGRTAAECPIPVEVNTVIDYCELPTTITIDSLAGCKNGTPRSLVPVGKDYVPAGTTDGTWDQKKFSNFDCCVFTEGVLKFEGNACLVSQDTVFLKDINLECFDDAFTTAFSAETTPIMSIGDMQFIVLSWDMVTRQLVLKPVSDDYLDGGAFLEYPASTQICLGECCRQCTNGPQMTNHNTMGDLGDPQRSALFVYETSLPYNDVVPTHYLIGHDSTGTTIVKALDTTWNDVMITGIGRPIPITPGTLATGDPLLVQQKFCETSNKGCPQDVDIEYNYEFALSNLVANLRVHWEFASFTGPAATLADDVTPNPYHVIASLAKAAGCYEGPSGPVDDILGGTSVNVGQTFNAKILPFHAGLVRDKATLRHCDCAFNIAWFYVCLQPLAPIVAGTAGFILSIRRQITKDYLNFVPQPVNTNVGEGFN